VAHELKTPLAAVKGAARALGRDDVDAGTRKRLLRVIDDAASQAELLVADLLLAGRLGASMLPLAVEPTDVSEAAATVVEAASVSGASVTLTATGQAVALADPGRLRQALASLVDNAVDHAPAETFVRVSVERAGDRVHVGVSDDGPGIPDDDRERVFEPYVRLTEREGGTGLGLYLARQLARAMGGDVMLEPSGTGATFRLDLPAG
jgi:signal transduction histidine kinase